jgi:plasmid segregation protein ParM
MVELKANPVIFIGGGAILLKQFIENSPMIAKADFMLDEKANAIGYAMLAAHQLKKSLV